MSESEDQVLPSGWVRARIEDLIGLDGLFVDGDWVESKDQDPAGDVRLIQLADIGDGTFLNRSARFLTLEKAHKLQCTFVKPGDALIARMPNPLGRACVFPGDPKRSVTAVDVCIVRAGSIGANNRWLVSSVNSPEFRRRIAALESGTTRKRISRSNLATIEFPVPPLSEQYRIVAEIDKQFTRLDAAIAALKRIEANLKRYRASVLKAACEGRLVPTEAELARAEGRDYEPADQLIGRILKDRRSKWESESTNLRKRKYVEPLPPDISSLPELPEGWVWASVDQIISESLIGLDRGRDQQNTEGIGVPYVKMNNVTTDGRVTFEDFVYVPASKDERDRFGLTEEDVLFNTRNSKELVGKAGLVRDMPGDAIYNNNLMRLRFSSGIIPAFVSTQMCSDGFRRRMELVKKATTNVAAVYAKDLFPLQLALPPLAEQHRILAEAERRLSIAAELDSSVKAGLRRADRLRQAILKRAFEGKLVPQDPNDEPAGALLERIRAERAKLDQAAKPAKGGMRRPSRRSVKTEIFA